MTVSIAELLIRIDSTQVRLASLETERLSSRSRDAEHATDRLSTSFSSLGRILAGVTSGFSAMQLATQMLKTIEQVQNLETRLQGLAKSSADYIGIQTMLVDLAKEHHKSNLDLQTSFAQLLTIEQTGIITRKQSIDLLTGMSNAQSRTGASAEALSQSMIGLTQALNMGTLAWEEVKQVTEPIPGLMQKIAEAAGFVGKSAIGDFKKIVTEGKYSSEMFGQILPAALATYSGAASATADNLTSKYKDVENAWIELAKTLESPVNSALTPVLEYLTAMLSEANREISALKGAFSQPSSGAPDNGMPDLRSTAFTSSLDNAFKQTSKQMALTKDQQDAIILNGKEYLELIFTINDADKKRGETVNKAADAAKQKSEAIIKAIQSEITAQDEQLKKLTMTDREYKAHELDLLKMSQAMKSAALAKWDLIKATEAENKSADAGKTAMEAEIDRYKQLTLSARDYYIEKLRSQNVSEQQIPGITEKHDINVGLEIRQQQIEEARQVWATYGDSIGLVKDQMVDLGSVTSSVFDGALGGISAMAGAFDGMINNLIDINSKLDEELAKRKEISNLPVSSFADIQARDQAIEDSLKKEQQLADKRDSTIISGTKQVAGATAKMFAENTKARKLFHNIEMVMAGIEMAMTIKKVTTELWGMGTVLMSKIGMVAPTVAADTTMATVGATVGVINQAQGDPYSAFPRMAAMAAIMAALGFAVAGAASGGGTPALPPPTTTGTGTVLGDSKLISGSLDNTYDLLKNIHAQEYIELRGINQGIGVLVAGITNTVNKLFQSGGVTAKLTSELGAGSTSSGGFLGGLFGGKTKEVVGGGIAFGSAVIKNIMAGVELVGNQFSITKTTKSSFFGGTKTSFSEAYSALDGDVTKAFGDVLKTASDVMLNLTSFYGQSIRESILNYRIPALKIDLAGMTGQEAVDKVSGVISSVLDEMADYVFGSIVSQYQKLGEGMLETASRIFAEVTVVKDILSRSGLSIASDFIAISDSLVQAAGGLEKFQTQFEGYYDNFYTDAEKQERLKLKIAGQLTEVNLLLPETREGYRKLIEALDINNQLDQQRYSLLLQVASAADEYYKSLENIMKTYADLEAWLNKDKRGESSGSSPLTRNAEYLTQIGTSYLAVKGGDLESMSKLTSLVDEYKGFYQKYAPASYADLSRWLHEAMAALLPSHATGLASVPYDGYMATLHKGERVLTAQEAKNTDNADLLMAIIQTEREGFKQVIAELRASNKSQDDIKASARRAEVAA